MSDPNISDAFSLKFAGQETQHSMYMYHMISKILERENASRIRGIIEFGTGFGALTTYLGLWGARLGIPVFSFDNDARGSRTGVDPIFNKLGIVFRQEDIFLREEEIKGLIRFLGPAYLVCDNGDKKKEFNIFVPALCDGSIVSVHDWNVEIKESDINETILNHKLVAVDPELWLAHGAIFASWVKGG